MTCVLNKDQDPFFRKSDLKTFLWISFRFCSRFPKFIKLSTNICWWLQFDCLYCIRYSSIKLKGSKAIWRQIPNCAVLIAWTHLIDVWSLSPIVPNPPPNSSPTDHPGLTPWWAKDFLLTLHFGVFFSSLFFRCTNPVAPIFCHIASWFIDGDLDIFEDWMKEKPHFLVAHFHDKFDVM